MTAAAPSPTSLPAPSRRAHRDPYPFALAAQATGIFSLVGAAFGLCIATSSMHPGTLPAFLQSNVLADVPRWDLFVGFLLGAFLGGLFAVVFMLVRRRPGVHVLRRAGDVISPLVILAVLPSMFSAHPWHDKPTTFLVGMAATVLALEALMRRSLRAIPEPFYDWLSEKLTFPPRVERWLPLGLAFAGFVFYAVYFSYYTILNHQRLNTTGFDLGIHVNWAYNAMHGHPERCPVVFGTDGGHFLGNHAIFAMGLWLPLFALWPSAEMLLILQATLAGLGVFTLYLFASTQTTRWSALVIAYCYLFFAPLHGPNFYDFHELMPPLPLHFLLYWAIAKRKNWLVVLLVPLLWSFREDVAVGLTVLGAFLLITGVRPRMGFFMALASVVWFVILKFEVMPRYFNTWFASIYKELQAPGKEGYGTVVQTILINPTYFLSTLLREEKLIYFLHMFGPLALLPARRWAVLMLAIPGFAFSILTTGYPPTISIAFQYACHSIPYVFAATVLMIRIMSQGPEGTLRRRAVIPAIALGTLMHSYVFGAILQHETFVGGFTKVEFRMTDEEKERYQTIKRMAAAIPLDAVVAASENEVPHVAARINAYTIKDGVAPDADYILINQNQINFGATRQAMNAMFSRAEYGVLMKGHGLYLFKKGHSSADTKAALRALGLKHPKIWKH